MAILETQGYQYTVQYMLCTNISKNSNSNCNSKDTTKKGILVQESEQFRLDRKLTLAS